MVLATNLGSAVLSLPKRVTPTSARIYRADKHQKLTPTPSSVSLALTIRFFGKKKTIGTLEGLTKDTSY